MGGEINVIGSKAAKWKTVKPVGGAKMVKNGKPGREMEW